MSYTLLLHDADRHIRSLRRHDEPRRVRAEIARERTRRGWRLPALPRLARIWSTGEAGASS
jgi:hypothetical protein